MTFTDVGMDTEGREVQEAKEPEWMAVIEVGKDTEEREEQD